MARKRETSVFSLSFLDIMSCGFGAVILVFIIINHGSEAHSQELNVTLMAEVKKLEEEVKIGTENLVDLRNTLDKTDQDVVTTELTIEKLLEQIRQLQQETADLLESGSSDEEIYSLQTELRSIEEEVDDLQNSTGANNAGAAARTVIGQGYRQYLTGIRVGGDRILILLDASTSMLHRSIVNAIRLGLMAPEEKLAAEKWQRAVRTVEWVSANVPPDADVRLVAFRGEPTPLSEWISATSEPDTEAMLERLRTHVPDGGSSLINVFDYVADMEPPPDNIFLITDGLPTQGRNEPRAPTVSSSERVKLFRNAIGTLEDNIPVNVVLFPMEGDPMATPYYWILAQETSGSFLAPSRDWP
ncbi:MAG: hypothetical protein CMQ05_09780 [Gammaproteobacteria bacterium]|uniref:VWFA domain-containing protein n=1 Tax=OM182 bacterium MED-G24 TaxID=1986255 RepID=A0A2A5WXJ3_9GAMM|nr:hypothetical protein [Gammaproteobacteria bacterium]PDH40983.1 MAG: hypothetical protein CNE99_02570 [OM182 bacterium MED-G24]RPG26841.1 MAG: VWA domain-containing protein [Gammaproteobacteria bacterium TMED50]|tara:strand:- start:4178 stop:5251 length:1074 start_codon:yes stop_codon:yes gene_type:complete